MPLLIDHFRKEFAEAYGRDVPDVSRAARQALIAHDWPGNIRQLRNTIERMLVLDSDGLLDVDDLPDDILPANDGDADTARSFSGADGLVGRPLTEVERFYIEQALALVDGKREDAAALLGIGERTLYRKIKEYGLNQ
jgi:two-component system response regulator HydG